jgi:arylsulfatase A-like enzyme
LPQNYERGSGEYWHRWFDRDWWVTEVDPKLSAWQAVCYAMTANLDWNVGRLLGAMDYLQLADNTIVVFTSDNCEMFGAHGRVQKNIFWEEALRVPFLIRWPGRVPAGQASDVCLNTPDIMPTLLSLVGAEIPSSVEGSDLSATPRCDAVHQARNGS